MASDWIRMRTNLRRHPKVIAMSRLLSSDRYRQRDHRIIAREEATKLERAVSSKVSPDPSLAPTSSAPTSVANTSDGLPPAMHGRPER